MYTQKEVVKKLNDIGINIKLRTLQNYEFEYKLISSVKRGAGYGGKWVKYDKVHLIEVATAYVMLHGMNDTLKDALRLQNLYGKIINEPMAEIKSCNINKARLWALDDNKFLSLYKEKYFDVFIKENAEKIRELSKIYEVILKQSAAAEAIDMQRDGVVQPTQYLYNESLRYKVYSTLIIKSLWVQYFIMFDLFFDAILCE